MLILLSPAKSLDTAPPLLTEQSTLPRMADHSAKLIAELKLLSPAEIGALMGISAKLAELNHARFQAYEPTFTSANSRPAILAFTGDVYKGMALGDWTDEDFASAQEQIRILSGLYGVLRPLDRMQPYRLEMGSKFPNARGKNLYEFWGTTITEQLNQDLADSDSDVLVNLASNEYFSAVKKRTLQARLITPVFKDKKNGKYKIISFYAKKARGMMADFIVRNKITAPEELKAFTTAGYAFAPEESTNATLVFLRAEK